MVTFAKQVLYTAALIALTLVPGLSISQASSSTTLGPGDVVRISVYGLPDLSTLTRIDDAGNISFPLLGSVTLQNRTTTEAEKHIAELLESGGIVRNAQVTLFLEERNTRDVGTVTILGKVGRPGKYPLQGDTGTGVASIVDLLATAGGTSDDAADHIFLMRPSDSGYVRSRIDLIQMVQLGELSNDQALVSGDVVLVPATDVFYIYGQVRRPGRYPLERDMTVMQALSVASGITDIGNENGILLRRREGSSSSEIDVEITTPLRSGDVIYVKAKRF